MKFQFSRVPGCVTFLLVLLIPAALMAYVQHNPAWLVGVPIGVVVLILAVAFVFGSLERLFGIGRRKVTPDQLADELERHLLGTGGKWDWDDTTSVVIADARLEQLRLMLPKFDSLSLESDRNELTAIIAALRRGEIPQVSWPKTPSSRHHWFFRLRR
jgi:hypothetical protein